MKATLQEILNVISLETLKTIVLSPELSENIKLWRVYKTIIEDAPFHPNADINEYKAKVTEIITQVSTNFPHQGIDSLTTIITPLSDYVANKGTGAILPQVNFNKERAQEMAIKILKEELIIIGFSPKEIKKVLPSPPVSP